MALNSRFPRISIIQSFCLLAALAALGLCVQPAGAQIAFTRLPGALDPIEMLNDAHEDHAPRIATDNHGHWVTVWSANNNATQVILPQGSVLVSRSGDRGLTWSTPAPLAAHMIQDKSTPQIATDGKGAWVCVWVNSTDVNGDNDIFYSRSIDNGENWSEAQRLVTGSDSDKGDDLHPRLVADSSGAMLAAWESTEPSLGGGDLGGDTDIVVARSTDGGAAWSAPLPLNTTATTDGDASDNGVDLAALGQGRWLAAWHSTNNLGGTLGGDEDILFARSLDGGATWSTPAALNSYATNDTWVDITPRLTADGQGNVVCCWVSAEAWTADNPASIHKALYVSRSADNGQTWQTAIQVKDDTGTPDVADETPALHTDGHGLWMAAWTLENGSLWLFLSSDQGATWAGVPYVLTNTSSPGHNYNPCLASDGSRHWAFAWDSWNRIPGGPAVNDVDIFASAFSVFSSGVAPRVWQAYE